MEQNSRVFGRFRPRHRRTSSLGEENLAYRTVDLQTSTIKIDADDTDLRLCFRIISPSKTYTLQVKDLLSLESRDLRYFVGPPIHAITR